MKSHPNLHVTFNNFQIHYGLEWLHEMGLGKQCVFSSNAPEMSMGAHRTYVSYAELPPEAQADISSGNLRRLLKGQGPEVAHVNPDEDELMMAARLGKPIPCPVYDMHIHMLHEGLNGPGGRCVMHKGGPRGTHALMQRLGYDGGGIMSWSVVSGDAKGGNELVSQALDVFPESYWGLGSFDPTHYSREDMRAMIDDVYADPRFVAVKPYQTFGVRYDHPSYECLWEYANERGFYALIHRIASDFGELNNLAPRYPNVTWVVAHCGASYATADMGIECVRKNPNVYLEITLTPVTFGIIDYMVAKAGEDRVVFGSDLPMRDPRQQLGWVVYSRLPLEAKAKVLGGNAVAILKKCGWKGV